MEQENAMSDTVEANIGTYREPASAGIPPIDYAARSQHPPKKRKKKSR